MPWLSVTFLDESTEKLWIKPKDRHEDRQSPVCSDDFCLADGRPLLYTLLNDPDALVMDATEADRARAELRDLFRIKRDIVRECVDGSLGETRETLRPIASLGR
jgi:hypothetical protein